MRLAEYYQTHYPRYDKYNKTEIIKFSNKTQYFATDFNSRRNLRLWLDTLPKEEAKKEAEKLLAKRRMEKGITYAPTQIELRSLLIPGMKYFNDNFPEGYWKLCDKLGYKRKFEHTEFQDDPIDLEANKIIVDSREQKPLRFTKSIKTQALSFGDYAIDKSDKTCSCYVERKSISDLYGTLSGGYQRFQAEIKRARDAGAYLVIVVENNYDSIYAFPYLRKIWGKVNISPEFILHNMRELVQLYPFTQFLFVENRKEAARVVEKIFEHGCEVPMVDLQYMYDLGKL